MFRHLKTAPLLAPLLTLGLALSLATAAMATEGWTFWRNDQYGVATSFPGAPTVAPPEPGDDGDLKVAFERNNDQAFVLAVHNLPTSAFDRRRMLELTSAAAIKAAEGPLISRRDLQLDDAVGVEIVVGPSPDNLYARIWIIIQGNRLIMVLESERGSAPELDALFTDLVLSPPTSTP